MNEKSLYPNGYYTKCLKCGHEVPTMSQFDEEYKNGEWFIGGDGWTWDFEHVCKDGFSKLNK